MNEDKLVAPKSVLRGVCFNEPFHLSLARVDYYGHSKISVGVLKTQSLKECAIGGFAIHLYRQLSSEFCVDLCLFDSFSRSNVRARGRGMQGARHDFPAQ